MSYKNILNMQIIDGKKIAEKIKNKIVKEILNFNGLRPNLAIILIGDREDSKLYVNLKEREAKKVGIDTHIYRCSDDISEKEIIEMIECLNNDELIDAILIQLPINKKLNTDKIIKTINPEKDVDRFHPENLKKLFSSCNHEKVIPPLAQVILEIFKEIKYEVKNKKASVLVNSEIFGKSITKVLECQNINAEIIYLDDKNLKNNLFSADILITAVGKPEFIKKDMIKKDALVIDIGITKKDKKIYGDVDFNDVKEKVGFITPVPGGVGPITIAMLFKNTLKLYKERH